MHLDPKHILTLMEKIHALFMVRVNHKHAFKLFNSKRIGCIETQHYTDNTEPEDPIVSYGYTFKPEHDNLSNHEKLFIEANGEQAFVHKLHNENVKQTQENITDLFAELFLYLQTHPVIGDKSWISLHFSLLGKTPLFYLEIEGNSAFNANYLLEKEAFFQSIKNTIQFLDALIPEIPENTPFQSYYNEMGKSVVSAPTPEIANLKGFIIGGGDPTQNLIPLQPYHLIKDIVTQKDNISSLHQKLFPRKGP